MKKLLQVLSLILLLSTILFAQNTTTTTGTIQYPDGSLFANGTVLATFTPPGGVINQNQYTINGATFPYFVSGVMNGSGTFSLTLTDDHKVRPQGGRWMFTVCSLASTSCVNSLQDVFGTSIDLSSNINGSISNILGSTLNIPRFYSDSEVLTNSAGGLMYYNLSSNTFRCYNGSVWATCNSGGGGTSPGGTNLMVQYNNSGSFGGLGNYELNVPLTGIVPPILTTNYNGSPFGLVLAATSAATNTNNFDAPILVLSGNYWNGTASAVDSWFISQDTRPQGQAPHSALIFSHIGANTPVNTQSFNIIFTPDAASAGGCTKTSPGFSSNGNTCMSVSGSSTTDEGAALAVFNDSTSGSNRSRIYVQGSITGSVILGEMETDPNLNGGEDFGMDVCHPNTCWSYLYVGNVNNNDPFLYLGGKAFGGASQSAIKIHLSSAGASKDVTFLSTVQTSVFTFAGLPACAGGTEGMFNAISDSTVNTWGTTITGGGTNHVFGYCDGTNWTVVAK